MANFKFSTFPTDVSLSPPEDDDLVVLDHSPTHCKENTGVIYRASGRVREKMENRAENFAK